MFLCKLSSTGRVILIMLKPSRKKLLIFLYFIYSPNWFLKHQWHTSPSWSECSGASGIGYAKQAVELPVLDHLVVPSATVRHRTFKVLMVAGCCRVVIHWSCRYTSLAHCETVPWLSDPSHRPEMKQIHLQEVRKLRYYVQNSANY